MSSEVTFVLDNSFAEFFLVKMRVNQKWMLEQCSGRRTLVFILDEALVDEVGEVGGPLRPEWRNVRVEDLQQNFLLVSHLRIRRIDIGQFKGEDTERPDIDRCRVFPVTLDKLRCHPMKRAYFCRSRCLLLRELHSEAEIGQLDVTSDVEKYVI